MIIKKIKIANFRNIKKAEIEPIDGINIFTGENAQGKSSFLEALAFISNGRSFRTSNDIDLINIEEKIAFLEAIFEKSQNEFSVSISITNTEKNKTNKKLTFCKKEVNKLSEFVGRINNTVFSKYDSEIASGNPSIRRNFIDKLLCSIDSEYLQNIKKFNTILKEKNALLKTEKNFAIAEILNEQISTVSAYISQKRNEIANIINTKANIINSDEMVQNFKIKFEYIPNIWYHGKTLEEIKNEINSTLKKYLNLEFEKKATLKGIQRDDYNIELNSMKSKKYASQGQLKLISTSLKLTEFNIIEEKIKNTPIFFMDDCFSELDKINQINLWNCLQKKGQIFLTSNGLPENYIENTRKKIREYIIKNGNIINIIDRQNHG